MGRERKLAAECSALSIPAGFSFAVSEMAYRTLSIGGGCNMAPLAYCYKPFTHYIARPQVCGDLPTPDAGHGEGRVKLEASGVNPSDTYRRRGPRAMQYPAVITNSAGAGIIDQVGPGVDRHRLGKRVWLYNGQRNGRWMGTAAEYIALSPDLVTELPDHVSFAEGATLGVPAMTAHRAVFVAGSVQGKIPLVTGGAGAVGHYAVQLASWAGATVIATVSSSEKADRARAGGAAHVINYRSEDVAARVLDITGGVGVDHIVEVRLEARRV